MAPAKIARAVAGIVVVVVLGVVILNWYSDFKTTSSSQPATQGSGSTTTSSTASGSSTTTGSPSTTGTVKTSGLNFRIKPSSAAKLIRALKKGETLEILAKDGAWYQVKDSSGRTGWVTASSDYIAVQGK